MATDLDIYRAAAVMARQFGSDAAREAAVRARSMGEKNDLEGQRIWERIARAVQELRNVERPADQTLQ
jgi:hypothetical protein